MSLIGQGAKKFNEVRAVENRIVVCVPTFLVFFLFGSYLKKL